MKLYSDEEMIATLVLMGEKLGRRPLYVECKNPSGRIYLERFGSFKKALELAGYHTSYKKYTRQDLIDIINNKAKKLGRLPYFKEIPERNPIVKEFGSYDNALRETDLLPRRKLTDGELLKTLEVYVKNLGYTPTFDECIHEAPFDPHTYYLRFGSWNRTLELANIKPIIVPKAPQITKEEFYKLYIQYSNETRRLLTAKEIDAFFKGTCASGTIYTWFGGMTKLKILAVSDPNLKISREATYLKGSKYTHKEIEEILKLYHEKYNDICTIRVLRTRLKEFGIGYSCICATLDIKGIESFWEYVFSLK